MLVGLQLTASVEARSRVRERRRSTMPEQGIVEGRSAQREEAIRQAWERRDFESAVRLTLDLYGCEILQYLIARMRGYDDGWDAFGIFADDLWRGIEGFAWRSSMRCWAYALARNASNRHAKARARSGRGERLAEDDCSVLAAAARSETNRCLQTGLKQRIPACVHFSRRMSRSC